MSNYFKSKKPVQNGFYLLMKGVSPLHGLIGQVDLRHIQVLVL